MDLHFREAFFEVTECHQCLENVYTASAMGISADLALPDTLNANEAAGITMDMIEIKKGGRYTVYSNSGGEEPMKTEGEFVGYTILGEEGAIVFKITNGDKSPLLRIIPVSGILSIEFKDEGLLSIKSNDKKGDKDPTSYIS